MGKNAAEGNRKKGKIAEEIRKRIGRSVLIAYIVVEVIIVIIMGQTVYYNKQAQLTLESESASNSLAGFFEKYERVTQTLALNPQIQSVLSETKAGDNILSAKAMGDVEKYLVDAAGADSENVMAVWIADLDASVITQSDGYTSPDGWDITGRAWYSCIETGKTVLTEPYIDSSTGEIILSAATPVYDEGGNVLGAAGMDISLDHVTEVLSGYTIGSNGYVWLVSSDGMLIYHPNGAAEHCRRECFCQCGQCDHESDDGVFEIQSGRYHKIRFRTAGRRNRISCGQQYAVLRILSDAVCNNRCASRNFCTGDYSGNAQYRQERICFIKTNSRIK